MPRATLDLETNFSTFEKTIESALFRHFVTVLIIVNAIILGVLTYDEALSDRTVWWLSAADQGITYVFAVEIFLKLCLYRFMFFRSGWNWFDFLVVGVSLIPNGSAFSVIRAMRVLRILRLLHIVPMMRRITEALLKALPGMGAIMAVLALVTYVGAVMATNMYGDSQSPEVAQLFGSLPKSAYSLFQVMTMDGWRFEVVQKVIDDGNPYAWVFFLLFIFIASFAILNLFIALIVDALSSEQKAMLEEEFEDLEDEIESINVNVEGEREQIVKLLTDMQAEIASLRVVIDAKK